MTPPPSSEYQLISRIQKLLPSFTNSNFEELIGDDAAVRVNNEAGEKLVMTTDISVQDVHFSLKTMTLEEVGYKAMVSNLSDCAAMGALPDSALVQLVFPSDCPDLDRSVESVYRGFARASERWRFPIVGGDLSSGSVWTIGIALIGSVPPGERVLKRRGIKAGDVLWVSGRPGKSAAGMVVLGRWGRQKAPETYSEFVQAHISPCPRIQEGRVLAGLTGVHAVMDLSDGLSKDVATLCYDNRLGFLFDSAAICTSEVMMKLAEETGMDWKEWFFHGGEEYELLVAADPDLDLRAQFGLEKVELKRLGCFSGGFEGVRIPKLEGGAEELVHRSWDHAKRIL